MSIFTIGFHEEREDGTCYANPTILYHIHIYHIHILYYLYYTIPYSYSIYTISSNKEFITHRARFFALQLYSLVLIKVIDFLKLSNS